MNVLMVIPSRDFDPSETAIPWKELKVAGYKMSFGTPDGRPGTGDPRMLSGEGLGLFKNSLVARKDAIDLYAEMTTSDEFLNPLKYDALKVEDFDAIILPGGHAPGMRPYLESTVLQSLVVAFFKHKKVVAAICLGTLLAARSRDEETGRSVLWGKKTTGLTRSQELFAWRLTKGHLGDYYRTYPTPLEDEVRGNLKNPQDDFHVGPRHFLLGIPLVRDAKDDLKHGFVVRDGLYLSARWPGDAYRFSQELIKLLRMDNL